MRKHSSQAWFTAASPASPDFSKDPAQISKILEGRREFVSSQLKEVCIEYDQPRILSLGNGAMRELEPVLGLCRASAATFVVLDGANTSPETLCVDYEYPCVRYLSYPFGAIPCKEHIGQFDFVYTLNLLNELDQNRAKATVRRMLDLVRPGGRLLLSNFTSVLAHDGLGGFHRREEEMSALLPDMSDQRVLGHAIWRDESRSILYLEVQTSSLVSRSRAPGPRLLQHKDERR